jgi:hypothetical protein
VKYREYMESTSLSDALINLIPIYGPWIIFGIVGNAVVFFRRFIAVLRMFAALLADANCMPAGRFFFFIMTGRVCWACLFVFGAYAVGAEIYKISGTLSVISLGLFIAARYPLSIFIRPNEVTLRPRAEQLCQIIRADYQLSLMARNGHGWAARRCLLLRVERTCRSNGATSVFDPLAVIEAAHR